MAINKEFFTVIRELVPDILTTFPECKETIQEHYMDVLEADLSNENPYDTSGCVTLYTHAKSAMPPHFFNILYKNEDMFDEACEFLPGLDFATLMKTEGVSDNTKEVLWKYIQLLLFSLVNDVKDQSEFGDTAKLFEAINEEEFKNALENTMDEMKSFFDMSGTQGEDVSGGETSNGSIPENMPNPEDIHDHLQSMMGGKIGTLAQEIANETASELNIDTEDVSSMNDVFKKLIRNPAKLMSLIQKVGGKLEEKMKSGDIKESELMEEAAEMVEKMKTMPGMKNMKHVFSKMGLPNDMLGSLGGGKVNLNAMQGALNQNIKMSKQKERMLRKLEERRAAMAVAAVAAESSSSQGTNAGETIRISELSTAEPLQQSSRSSKPSKKKKGKGKKGKKK